MHKSIISSKQFKMFLLTK